MKKKFLFASVLLVAIGLVCSLILYLKVNRPFEKGRCLDAVPPSAFAILMLDHPANFINETDTSMMGELVKIPALAQAFDFLPLISKNIGIEDWNWRDRSCCQYFMTENDSVYNVLSVDCKDGWEEITLKKWLRNSTDFSLIESSNTRKVNVYRQNNSTFLTEVDGCLLISSSIRGIEISLDQLNEKQSVKSDSVFQKIRKSLGASAPAHLFLLNEMLSKTLSHLLNNQESIDIIAKSGKWSGFDLDISSGKVHLSGFLLSTPGNNYVDRLLSKIEPDHVSVWDQFPSSTCNFLLFQVKPFETQWTNNLILAGNLSNQLRETIIGFMDGEIALVNCHVSDSLPLDRLLVVKTHSQARALNELSHCLTDSSSVFTPVDFYSPDGQFNIPIYQGFADGQMDAAFRGIINSAPGAFFSMYNNSLVFANDKESIVRFLNANLMEMTLGKDAGFKAFLDKFPATQNVMIYIAPSFVAKVLNGLLNSAGEKLCADIESQNMFRGLALQLSSGPGPIYVNAVLEMGHPLVSDSSFVWQRKIEGAVMGVPHIVRNHETGYDEILVQDSTNQLYLINGFGIVLWKIMLDGPILGDVHQIDCYKNDKLQYVFNTGQNLYLIDRNGNHLPNFPVKLDQAVQPVVLIDYENTNDYRFFIVEKDGSVHVYNQQGNYIPDWKLKATENSCVIPPQHFDERGKDYWVFADSQRHYLVDRRGNERCVLSKEFIQGAKMTFVLNKVSKDPSLLTIDTQGRMVSVSLPSGNVTELPTPTHSVPLAMQPLFENKGFAVVDSSFLYVFNNAGEIIWQADPVCKLEPVVRVCPLPKGDYLIAVQGANSQIFLYHSNGMLCEGFPVQGTSLASVGKFGAESSDWGAIVGGSSNILSRYPIEIDAH